MCLSILDGVPYQPHRTAHRIAGVQQARIAGGVAGPVFTCRLGHAGSNKQLNKPMQELSVDACGRGSGCPQARHLETCAVNLQLNPSYFGLFLGAAVLPNFSHNVFELSHHSFPGFDFRRPSCQQLRRPEARGHSTCRRCQAKRNARRGGGALRVLHGLRRQPKLQARQVPHLQNGTGKEVLTTPVSQAAEQDAGFEIDPLG